MKDFFALTKKRQIAWYKWTTVFCTILFLVFIANKSSQGYTPDYRLLIWGFFFLLLLPLFTSVAVFGGDFLKFKRINAVLDSSPFNELTKIGLTKTYSNRDSKMLNSDPILSGLIDDYPFECTVENGILRITAQTNLDSVKEEHIKKLKTQFGEKHIEYDFLGTGIALVYNSKRRKQTSFNQLETELRQLVGYLKNEKLLPWDNTAAANKQANKSGVE